MKSWASVLGLIVVLTLVKSWFGQDASMWVAAIVLAFCVGAMWGSGGVIVRLRKDR